MTRRLMTAIAFLTRIPINPEPPFDGEDVARSTVFFPLVGCLMAALQVAVLYGLQGLAVPPVLQAVIVTIIMVLLGGGLHQDGLADMADGFGGGMTRDDVLRIMRDSTIGTYGGLALILSMALRIASLSILVVHAGAWQWLIAAAAISRCSICLAWLMPYARSQGTGASITQFTGPNEVAGACVFALLVSFFLLGLQGIAAWLITGLVFLTMAWLCRRRIGGVTGDTIGATTETTEVLLLALGATLVGAAS